jgi:hypothetical protein
MNDGEKLMSAREVLDRLGICNRTLTRWSEDESLGFPPPVIIRNRRYWPRQALANWERSLPARRCRETPSDA